MRRIWKWVAALAIVVVAAGGFGFWYFWVRDDAPPPATLRERSGAETSTTAAGATGSTTAPGASAVAGAWKIAPDPKEVFVGYRVDELFANETLKKTAVGRTPAVDGSITIDGTKVTDGEFTADLTQLSSEQSRRDSYLEHSSLQTSQFPNAKFTLTAPIDLGAPVQGKEVTVRARGDLTLHGVTKPVELELTARWNGGTIDVLGNLPVRFADYDIEKPSVPILTTDDHGVMEVKLSFERA
jgi:polyisoprenoid-binding protein YceI